MMLELGRRALLRLGLSPLLAARAAGARGAAVSDLRSVVPEFLRSLDRILICVPSEPRSLGMPRAEGPGAAPLARFVRLVFSHLLDALPSYTAVHVLAGRESRELALRLMQRAGSRTSRLHLVEAPEVEIELWAQDLGEPLRIGGRDRFLVARGMGPATGAQSKMSHDRRRAAEAAFGKDAVVEAGFVFEGGNLAFDAPRGTLRVLVGANDVSRTLADRDVPDGSASRADVLQEIGTTFGAAEVVEMGGERQSPLLQHIDQAFVLLENEVAVACRIAGGGLQAESRQLSHYASQLQELGYRLAFLDHRAEDLEGFRSSINVVPFVEKTTGRRRILLPVFPGEVDSEAKAISRAALRGKAARAYDLYRELGYEPSPIPDATHPLGGNTHCIVNVLS